MSQPWHFTTWLDLVDHWQTLIAGVLAILAAVGTIWATIRSADREIAASQEQTGIAREQIATTLRLEQSRSARESYAFYATIWAAMERVLLEASEAEKIFLSSGARKRCPRPPWDSHSFTAE